MCDEAEKVVKERSQSKELSKAPSQPFEIPKLNFPRLQTGDLEQPYAVTKGGVTAMNSERLPGAKQPKYDQGIRHVEDPVVAKKAAIEVRISNASLSFRVDTMKNIINSLSRVGRRLGLPLCKMKSYKIIVTLSRVVYLLLSGNENYIPLADRAQEKKATAGKDWFDLPRTVLTPELKRDLQLLKMRNVLDPHRHYKKEGGKMQPPEHSQVGTIIEGPTEFFTGRIEHKKRKRTLVEEVLAGEQETGRFKKKYGELQSKKTSGKKAFYKELKAKRKGGVKKGGD